MKKILLPICFIIVFFLMASCKKSGFLDATIVTDLNAATVFSDSTRTINFLENVYTQVGFSFNPAQFGNAGLESACDEAEGFSNGGGDTFRQFETGVVNPANTTAGPWNTCYKNIRAVNLFLKNIPKVKMEPFIKTHAIGEAIFLRAWFYSILLKHYGGVPIIGDTVYNADDKINATRNSYSECVDYIVSECTRAEPYMPFTKDPAFYGRASGGACLALISRVLLYAASPLFNEGNIYPANNLTGYANYDANRWKRAADAAKLIIDGFNDFTYVLYDGENKTGTDSLSQLPGHSFHNLFVLNPASLDHETIFTQASSGQVRTIQQLWLPPSRTGTRHAWPYQETAEAFGMNNGRSITDPASGYNPQDPYKNRDPRFDYTILHNGQLLFKVIKSLLSDYEPLLTYEGANTGDGYQNGTPTGYYIGKMLDDRSTANYIFGVFNDYPLIRYAEILLNYAEAKNEFSGPDPSIYDQLKAIRKRAGILPGVDGLYGLKSGMSQTEMRETIRNERRVELAFESHRFWDVRRWKIADQTENQQMHAMKITKQAGNNFTYQRVPISKHTFNQAMYFWPIPQSETAKSVELKQNPGY